MLEVNVRDTIEYKLEKTKDHIIKLLSNMNYEIEHFSFCIVAARIREYRLIIVVISGMDLDETQKQIKKLEEWPMLGTDFSYITKEVWIQKESKKDFNVYKYDRDCWTNGRGRLFDLEELNKILIQKPRIMPRMSRGHIDKTRGCVYFLYSPDSKAVKIGKTINLKQRLSSHKTSLPGAKLLGIIETSEPYELESDLHRRFIKYRIDREWFEFKGEIKAYIDRRVICQKNL